MSTIISLKDVAAQLGDLIHRLNPGEEVVIVENDRPVATLVVAARDVRRVPRLGTQPGSVLYMAPDFDSPLKGLNGVKGKRGFDDNHPPTVDTTPGRESGNERVEERPEP